MMYSPNSRQERRKSQRPTSLDAVKYIGRKVETVKGDGDQNATVMKKLAGEATRRCYKLTFMVSKGTSLQATRICERSKGKLQRIRCGRREIRSKEKKYG